jgi:hypothetical protein
LLILTLPGFHAAGRALLALHHGIPAAIQRSRHVA